MEYNKYLVLLCLFNEILETKELNSRDIITKYNINNRQMWSYIKNLKEYFEKFTNMTLIYDRRKIQSYINALWKTNPVNRVCFFIFGI